MSFRSRIAFPFADAKARRAYHDMLAGGAPSADPYADYIVFDSVTRADSSTDPGSATEKGGAWIETAGGWGVRNGAIYNAAPMAIGGHWDALVQPAALNGSIQLKGTSASFDTNYLSVLFRELDETGDTFLSVVANSGILTLYSCIAGSFVALASGSGSTAGLSHVLKASYSGTAVEVSLDGTQVFTYTLTGDAATIAGINAGPRAGSTNAGAIDFDDIQIT